jgi:hypothetical protein
MPSRCVASALKLAGGPKHGTHSSGTVAAASDWDGPMQIMRVRPAMPKSYER